MLRQWLQLAQANPSLSIPLVLGGAIVCAVTGAALLESSGRLRIGATLGALLGPLGVAIALTLRSGEPGWRRVAEWMLLVALVASAFLMGRVAPTRPS